MFIRGLVYDFSGTIAACKSSYVHDNNIVSLRELAKLTLSILTQV